jgi:His-Xaa-Ser system protein HxsD
MADVSGRQNADRQQDQEDAVGLQAALVPAWLGDERTAALSVSRAVYSRTAVLATAYKLSDRCVVLVDTDGDERWILYLVASPGADVKALLPTCIRELGDQALREQLEQEFGQLRTLIVAQAFSEGNLLDPARDTADDRLDPCGTADRR